VLLKQYTSLFITNRHLYPDKFSTPVAKSYNNHSHLPVKQKQFLLKSKKSHKGPADGRKNLNPNPAGLPDEILNKSKMQNAKTGFRVKPGMT